MRLRSLQTDLLQWYAVILDQFFTLRLMVERDSRDFRARDVYSGEPLAGFFLLCDCFVMEHQLRVIAVVRQRCKRVGLSRFVDLLRAIVQSLIVERRFACTVLILSVMCCRPPCARTFDGLRER